MHSVFCTTLTVQSTGKVEKTKGDSGGNIFFLLLWSSDVMLADHKLDPRIVLVVVTEDFLLPGHRANSKKCIRCNFSLTNTVCYYTQRSSDRELVN